METSANTHSVRRFHADIFFYAALLPACFGWLLPAPEAPPLWRLLLLAFAEEAVFRGGGQALLEIRGHGSFRQRAVHVFSRSVFKIRLGKGGTESVTLANVCVSALFAVVHLFGHPPMWALGTFFPSLVFGVLYTRYKRITPCFIAHALYNLAYFGVVAGG